MEKLTRGWVQHLRNASRQETPARGFHCPLCKAEVQPNLDSFKGHVTADALKHSGLSGDSAIEEAFKKIILQGNDYKNSSTLVASSPQDTTCTSGTSVNKRPVSGNAETTEAAQDELDRLNLASDDTEGSRPGSKKLCSPPASISQHRGSSPPTPDHSRVQQSDKLNDFDFHRGLSQRKPSARQLWVPEDDCIVNVHSLVSQRPKTPQMRHGLANASHAPRRSPQQKSLRRQQRNARTQSFAESSSLTTEMIRQLDTRPISSDQLVAEVKGIYAGLVLLESKCIQYDSSQQQYHALESNCIQYDPSQQQYQALISLHRSLLHEHHDFFLASQHPSASDALRRLASKYAMPARMWRHGIHSFLELLRHKLPKSLEHMLTFIYIAYSMMALLYETVPAFKDTWIECLGDLGRYRMAIEDDDIRDREIWTCVSRYWYAKASDNAPTTGRLYHHLAILARPNALGQLYYYAKSLCVPIPFLSARESVMTLFDPLLSPNSASNQRLEPVDAAFVRVHGILFSGKAMDHLDSSIKQFLGLLDSRIGREHGNWLESGYHVGISLSCLLLGFGNESNVLMRVISAKNGDGEDDTSMSDESETTAEPNSTFDTAVSFAEQTYKIVIERWGDKNTLPCLHTTLVFYYFMTQRPAAMKYLEDKFPWKLTSVLLNYLLRTCDFAPRIDTTEFPGPEKNDSPHPLPEDYAMRGLIYTEDYFPRDWFDNDKIEYDEKYFEPASTVFKRCERILWIGRMIARHEKWLVWDTATYQFTVTTKYDVEVQNMPVTAFASPTDAMAYTDAELARGN